MIKEVEKNRKRVLGVENFMDLLSLFHAFAIRVDFMVLVMISGFLIDLGEIDRLDLGSERERLRLRAGVKLFFSCVSMRLVGAVVCSPNQASLTTVTIIIPSFSCASWLADGNAKKQSGFWVEVMESKTKQYGRRIYDMVVGKWKTVRSSVIRFCGIYNNVMRMAQESGAEDEDYVQRAMIHYEIETEIPFKLHHWDILKDRPKWQEIALPKFLTWSGGSKRHKSSGSSSFNTESREQSINLNTIVGDTDEDEVQEIRPEDRDKARAAARKKKGSKSAGSSNVNEDALAKLMVTERTAQEKEERLAFLDIKRRKVECRERELEQ
ncbi:glutathione S-transferase T3-like protein [Tanacetum coccineum]